MAMEYGETKGPFPTDWNIDIIAARYALDQEVTQRGVKTLDNGKPMSSASSRFSPLDILYALEKFAPSFRSTIPSKSPEPYLSKLIQELVKEHVLREDGNNTWTYLNNEWQ